MFRYIKLKMRFCVPEIDYSNDLQESLIDFYEGINHNTFYPEAIYDNQNCELFISSLCNFTNEEWMKHINRKYNLELNVNKVTFVDWFNTYNEED